MDKKKPLGAESGAESDRQFLERNGVDSLIQTAISRLIQMRPKDPVDFLARYFSSMLDNPNALLKAQELVTMVHFSKPAFRVNLKAAYDQLSIHPKRFVLGVTGDHYMALLRLLVRDYPVKVQESISEKLMCRDHEVVSLDLFGSMVTACLIIKEFLKEAENIYNFLDTHKSNQVDKHLCDGIITHLTNCTKCTDSPADVLQASVLLSPDKIYSAVATNMFNNRSAKSSVTREQFVVLLTAIILKQLKPVK